MAGNEGKFTDAVTRLQAALLYQRDQGSTHGTLLIDEAKLAMLFDDEERALKKIEELATYGIGLPDFSRGNPIFKALEADGHGLRCFADSCPGSRWASSANRLPRRR